MSDPIADAVRRAEGFGMILATVILAVAWGVLAGTGHDVGPSILVGPLAYGLWQRFAGRRSS